MNDSELMRNEKFRQDYNQVLDDWLETGIVEPVDEQSPTVAGKVWYFSHFPVVRKEAVSTRVRPVMDGKAKFRGKCLNDAVYAGPNFLNNLKQVITRARKNPIF